MSTLEKALTALHAMGRLPQRWLPGMLVERDGTGGIQRTRLTEGYPEPDKAFDWRIVVDDPATIGCLMVMSQQAHGCPGLHEGYLQGNAVWVVWEGPGRDFKGKGSTRGLAWEDSLHNALIALAQEGPPSQQALTDQINELVAILDYRGWPVEALLNQTKLKSHDLALFVAYANQRGLQDAADWLRSL